MKKILSICLCILLVSTIFCYYPTNATADNIDWELKNRGECGKSNMSVIYEYYTHNQNLENRYYNNRLSLTTTSGLDSGVMENYVYKNNDFYSQYLSHGIRKWNSFFSNVYMLELSEGIKVIGDHAFNFGIYYNGISSNIIPLLEENTTNVHYFSLPKTLEKIGFCGFAGALKYVDELTLPSSMSTLGIGAFCSNGFSTVVIEEGNLTTIPSYCFANCSLIEEIYIPNTVTSIDASAFMGCTSLKTIYYGGYEEDWENINIQTGNDALLSAQIKFPIKVHVTSISLNATNKTLMSGNTYVLTANVMPENADIKQVVWRSTNPEIATVSEEGIVYALSPGTTTIYATTTDGNLSASCRISVQKVAVEKLFLNKNDIVMHCGGTEEIIATISPASATNKNITWHSSAPAVAYVNDGVIVGCSKGITIITATANDNGESDTCTVTVEPHKYDNDCDTDCNICFATRTITHKYDNACDTTCNICDAVREVPDHVYDHACDTDCNICGDIRTISHDYAVATCTEPKTCKVCGMTSGNKLSHKYDTEKITKAATCKTTGVKTYTCSVCKGTKNETIAKLTTHSYSNNCDKSCNVCGKIRTVGAHKYSNNCDTSCNVCKATRTITHSYKTTTTKATLTKNGSIVKKCTVCGKVASKTAIKYAKTFKLSTTTYTYDGKAKTPSVTVKDSAGKTLKKNTDYTVTYASGRKNVGTYKVTIKMIGKYSGIKTLTFKINPAKTTVSKLTAGKKSITVAITKKSTQVTGYQIQYGASKTFSKATTKTISSYKTTKYTLKSLSAKKTYYVRVRTYKKVGSTTYYSGWSTYKYIKTK